MSILFEFVLAGFTIIVVSWATVLYIENQNLKKENRSLKNRKVGRPKGSKNRKNRV